MDDIDEFFKLIDAAGVSVAEFCTKSGRSPAAINRWRSTNKANKALVAAAMRDAQQQIFEKGNLLLSLVPNQQGA